MKLLLYIDTLRRGGAERVMSVIASYFSNKYEVTLVNNVHDSASVDQYEINKNVKRYYLDDMYKKTGNCLIKTYQRILKLREICKAEKIEVGLSFLGNGNIRFLISTIGLKMKKIVSVRNDPIKEYKGKEFFAKWLFKKADGVVFQTDDAKSWFPKKVQQKSSVILNPVNPIFFETIWKQPTNIKIVTTGRLVKQKNHEMLIKAFKIVHDKFPEAMLYIYGSDYGSGQTSRKKQLNSLVKYLSIEDKVLFPGNSDNVPKLLSNSTMFVLSSDYEGMPNALMEAMAVGLPCISTDCPCGGPRTIIKDGENGLLVKVGDYESLADKMISVLDDKELLISLANNAKKSANDFKTELIMQQWEEYLSKK